MKIILIDDDNLSIKGLSFILQKYCSQHQIVGTFNNGFDSISFLKNNLVDLVITDIKMPFIDGIGLIKELKRIRRNLPIIAISAYSDFEYVRKSLLFGANDYLLKPFDDKSIVSIVNKMDVLVKETIKNQKKKTEINNLHDYLICSGNNSFSYKAADTFFVGLVKIHADVDEKYRQTIVKKILLGFPKDTLNVVINEDVVMVFQEEQNNSEVFECIEKAIVAIRITCGNNIWFSYYKNVKGSQLPDAYNKCTEIVDFLLFNKMGYMFSYTEYCKLIENRLDVSIEKFFDVPTIVDYLLTANQTELNSYFKKAWAEVGMKYAVFLPEHLKNMATQILIDIQAELQKELNGFRFNKKDDPNGNVYTLIQQSENSSRLILRFNSLLLELINEISSENLLPKYILNAIYYIKNNYMKSITLTDISKYSHVNRWYLSTQFNKFIGIPISEYQNKVKIERSKELLLYDNLKIYQISSMVGFSDSAYFTTVFRRFESLTPKAYQKKYMANVVRQ